MSRLQIKIMILMFLSLVIIGVRSLWVLANGSPFMPHAYCIEWAQPLLAIEVGSHLFTWLAYTGIPLLLFWCLRKQRGGQWPRWVTWSFITFITFCGFGHLVSAIVYFIPAYWLEAGVHLCTAILSVATLIALPVGVRYVTSRPSYDDLQAIIDEMRHTQRAVNDAADQASVTALLSIQMRFHSLMERVETFQARLNEHISPG